MASQAPFSSGMARFRFAQRRPVRNPSPLSQARATILATTLVVAGNREAQEVPSAMFDMFFDDDSDSRPAEQTGKHCDACGEWLDSSDTHCPSCGSER